MVAIICMAILWFPIGYELFILKYRFDWKLHGIFLGATCPVFVAFLGVVLNNMAEALRYHHDDELPLLASQLSIRFLGTLPVLLILASDAVAQTLSMPTLYNSMCSNMPGAKPPKNGLWYRNCTTSSFPYDMMNPEEKINVMYSNAEVITQNTSVVELYEKLELKSAIEDYVPVPMQCLFKMFQSGEVILITASSIILSWICRLSYRDFFAGRTSLSEMTFLTTTAMSIFMEHVITELSLVPTFNSPLD